MGEDPQSAAVTIIDLDAKSLNRLERWKLLDRRVLTVSMDDDEFVWMANKASEWVSFVYVHML